MTELLLWLQRAGLERYEPAFKDAAIELDIVADLTESDLQALGLPLGDRRRFRKLLESHPPASAEGGSDDPESATTTKSAQHRQMTVLFCDLVGWTALSTNHDPEELRETLNTCRTAWEQSITRYDGFVASHLGDGLMAYFGYPNAHEDDAERAILAGLKIVASIEHQQKSAKNEVERNLLVRVGIATGKVLVDETISSGEVEEINVVGYTPNLASRLQNAAEPNTVVVSATTEALTRHRFHVEVRDNVEIKGVDGFTRIFKVVRRAQSQESRALSDDWQNTPLVGRLHEVGLLKERWKAAQEGEGQIVVLSGEAGIGKSRVAEALYQHVADDVVVRRALNCSSYHVSSALHPIIEYLSDNIGTEGADEAELKARELVEFLVAHDITDQIAHALFAELLSIQVGADQLPAMSSERKKEETLRNIVRLLLHSIDAWPTLILLEDVHWADPTSLELLDVLASQVHDHHALLIITIRDDTEFRVKKLPHVTSLQLNRLTRNQALEVVRHVSKDVPLSLELVVQIIDRADGIPLFLEEITKTIRDNIELQSADSAKAGSPSDELMAIPATLYDSLMSRLDNYPEVKETVGCASVIGREFSEQLLSAVLDLDPVEARRRTDQLVEAELVLRKTRRAVATYTFKHALVQDAAYESMMKGTRKQLHERIAITLEAMFPDVLEQSPEIIAQHFQLAGNENDALKYWEQAGRQSMERSATKEAIVHFKRALTLLEGSGQTENSLQRLMTILTMYGAALTSVKGYTSTETIEAYEQAWALCEKLEDTSRLQEILYGMWNSAQVGSDYEKAWTLSCVCLGHAKDSQDPMSLLIAHNLCGVTAVLRGQHEMAYSHLKNAVELYDPTRFRSIALATGDDPGVESLSYLALNRWFVGEPTCARRYADRSIELAREIAYKHTLIYSLSMTGALLTLFRLPEELVTVADEIIILSKEQDYPYFLEWGQNLKGWSLVELGSEDEGIALMNNEWKQGFSSLLYAKACICLNDPDAGLGVIDDVIDHQPCYKAEAYRTKGELLLLRSSGSQEQADAYFQQAIKVAEMQGANSLRLRAAVSLTRSRRKAGSTDDASDLLNTALQSVNKDYVSSDLREATELLTAKTAFAMDPR